ncbi:uncharacterized protein LOC114522610 [Dendronephthya gigantea]|uniref:uncharacterized protein LOC114522610 n=1 Tax=Dendronephthya gigantea TaxID=151771 RepID=UPI00106A831A|nr:uncharacterized protein LOC114522610 [Dendronephthya gigantea]
MGKFGNKLRRSFRGLSFRRRNRGRRNEENAEGQPDANPIPTPATEPASEDNSVQAENMVSSEMSQQAGVQDQSGSSDEASLITPTENIPGEQNAEAASKSKENVKSSEISHGETAQDCNVQHASNADGNQRSEPKSSNLLSMKDVGCITKTERGNPIRQDGIGDQPVSVSSEMSEAENFQDLPGPSSNVRIAENNQRGRNDVPASAEVRASRPPSANLLLIQEARNIYRQTIMLGNPVTQDAVGHDAMIADAEEPIEAQNQEDDGYSTD